MESKTQQTRLFLMKKIIPKLIWWQMSHSIHRISSKQNSTLIALKDKGLIRGIV
jgi:hypothetical protein